MTTTTAKLGRVGRRRTEPDQSTYSGRLAARVRELREGNGVSVEQAAKKIGISKFRLYSWESASRPIDPDLYPRLAKAIGCDSIADLFPAK